MPPFLQCGAIFLNIMGTGPIAYIDATPPADAAAEAAAQPCCTVVFTQGLPLVLQGAAAAELLAALDALSTSAAKFAALERQLAQAQRRPQSGIVQAQMVPPVLGSIR